MIRGKIKKMMAAALAATMVFTMTACGSDSEEKTADGYAKEIYLYNWSEYMSEDVLNKFEEEYGIKVVETTFESNDEMLAKLMAGGGSEYDIAVPSNFYIESMKANDLLEPLDKDVITIMTISMRLTGQCSVIRMESTVFHIWEHPVYG